jgi:hypothetical protein
MKRLILLIFCISTPVLLSGQDQYKNIFGVSGGVAPAYMNMYFDNPFNFFPNREIGPVAQIFYTRQVRESFRIGSYIEFEKVRFSDNLSTAIKSFRRYNIGVNWLGQFPKTQLHLQLGGYAGYGFLRANGWDNLNGFDLGLIAGPAFEKEHTGIALHVHSGYAWYESKGTPHGVMLYTPKILLKIYYKM